MFNLPGFIRSEHDGNCFTFVVLSDSKGKEDGMNKEILKKLLVQIKKLVVKPRFIAILGDSVAGSEDPYILRDQLLKFKALVGSNFPGVPIIPVFGNHEAGQGSISILPEKVYSSMYNELSPDEELINYNKTVYYKDFGSLRIIVLNCVHCGSRNKVPDDQLQWLEHAAGQTNKHKILLIHKPPYPTGAHLNNCLDIYPEDRDKLWSIIDECGIDIVLCGHEHNYSRKLIDASFNTESHTFNRQIYQVTTGGGGEKLKDSLKSKKGVVVKPKAKYHFMLVTVSEKELYFKAISMEGKTLDDFVLSK